MFFCEFNLEIDCTCKIELCFKIKNGKKTCMFVRNQVL